MLKGFNLNREAAPLATSSDIEASFPLMSFNLNREAAPLATEPLPPMEPLPPCFNLNREAAPLATWGDWRYAVQVTAFQSQPRSRSISDPLSTHRLLSTYRRFNLNREAAPLATK